MQICFWVVRVQWMRPGWNLLLREAWRHEEVSPSLSGAEEGITSSAPFLWSSLVVRISQTCLPLVVKYSSPLFCVGRAHSSARSHSVEWVFGREFPWWVFPFCLEFYWCWAWHHSFGQWVKVAYENQSKTAKGISLCLCWWSEVSALYPSVTPYPF